MYYNIKSILAHKNFYKLFLLGLIFGLLFWNYGENKLIVNIFKVFLGISYITIISILLITIHLAWKSFLNKKISPTAVFFTQIIKSKLLKIISLLCGTLATTTLCFLSTNSANALYTSINTFMIISICIFIYTGLSTLKSREFKK